MAVESHFFMYKVVVQFNMTCACMMNWINNEIGGTDVVTVEQGGKGKGATKFIKEEANPNSFCTCVTNRSIFRLSARSSNSQLLFRKPRVEPKKMR